MKNICTYNYILTSGKISDSMIEERSNCTEYCGYPEYKGDGYCDWENNNCGCEWDGGDCCGDCGYSYALIQVLRRLLYHGTVAEKM